MSADPVLIGVVHLLPLPGGPRPSPGLDEVVRRAVTDAIALRDGGATGLIVENFGDAPFERGAVAPATIAAMTRAALGLRSELPATFSLGINVLRNDARAALGIAAAVGADFVRINVHTGAMVTDQGLIEGDARATLLERARICAGVKIAADVLVKHAVPLGSWTLEDAARDTVERGLADVLIVTGSGTGQPTDPDRVRRVMAVARGVPVWVGSGLTPETVGDFPRLAGAIVGTWLHQEGDCNLPIERDRVARMAEALRSTSASTSASRRG